MSDDTWVPKSPDLSFYAAGPTPPAEPAAESQQLFSSQLQSQSNFSHLQHVPPRTSPYEYFQPSSHQPLPHAPNHQNHHSQHYQLPTPPQVVAQAQARHTASSPHTSQTPSGFGAGVGHHSSSVQHEYYPPRSASYPTATTTAATGYSHPGTGYTAAQAPPPPPSFYQPLYRGSSQYSYSPPPPHQFPPSLTATQPQQPRHPYEPPEPASAGGGEGYGPSDAMPPRRAAAAAAAAAVAAAAASDDNNTGGGPSSASPAAVEAAPVKTKFPTARIKRIMQADEEVGKVAQQTPIAVGKALEMFMVALVTRSADVARQRSSKRVSAQMLKQVVESDDQWDFLRDIVGKVDGEEKGGKGARAKAESESDEDAPSAGGGGGAGEGKRKRGGGRKKKV
ncbi:hypothetical protein C8A05DRAFT_44543 [Staphylotrichum tortipilum]|uniref:Transcription factor CBF/NF-Y/archaeal histone domain-containing protein n=1 Tax=Staphylotrichum tortipilum TaxID=2831512 RepID=A0AAN6ML87_9PEZI|nr:hypothetical protein C8A05DRAFT_44543 [Staphylotrichum longicolle]